MSNKFEITNPVWDKVYDAYAWRDNNRILALVQGEGITIPDGTEDNATVTAFRAKAPRFQLKDDRGVIDLSSGNPDISWAIQRPNRSEDIVACNIVVDSNAGITAADGIIEIPITASATRYAGDVYGEIRLITSNGTTKFYGIDAKVGQGVSDDAAAQSTRYSALIAALQKVVAVNSSNVAVMDDLTSGGDLRNGTNPVASGNLKTYLTNKYIEYLQDIFLGIQYAHEAHSSSYTEENPVDNYNDGGVYIDDAIDIQKYYLLKNSNDTVYAVLTCVTVPAALYSYGATQFKITRTGSVAYRTSTIEQGKHVWDNNWKYIESKSYKDTGTLSNSDDNYPSSKLVKTELSTKESSSNKDTTSLNSSNHNTYPSSKLVQSELDLKENLRYAYPDGVSDADMANITNGARLRDCTSPNTIYLVRNGTDITNGDLLGIMICTSMTNNNGSQAQFQFTRDGVIKYRTRANTSESWPSTWISFETVANKDISTLSDSNDNYPSSKLVLDTLNDFKELLQPIRTTITLSSALWSNGAQTVTIPSGIYTLTANTKVDADIDSTTFSTLQDIGCYGIYFETQSVNNNVSLTANAIGATPSSNITVQLILTEVQSVGINNGGGNE